jgi:hypothetical protein
MHILARLYAFFNVQQYKSCQFKVERLGLQGLHANQAPVIESPGRVSEFLNNLHAARSHQAKVASTWMVSVGQDEPTDDDVARLNNQRAAERIQIEDEQRLQAASLADNVMLSTGAVCMCMPQSSGASRLPSQSATSPASVSTLAKRSWTRAKFVNVVRSVMLRCVHGQSDRAFSPALMSHDPI